MIRVWMHPPNLVHRCLLLLHKQPKHCTASWESCNHRGSRHCFATAGTSTVAVKTPPTVKRGVREQPSPMPYASLFKKEDLDKIEDQWEADRKAMAGTMPFDSVIGIHVNEFANVFDEKVAIFVHTIDYFIEVLDHFRDYLLQEHRHSVTNQRLYFIGNEIHITVQEYQYLRNYLNTLKKHTLPALKAKIQAAALKEHKRIKKKIEALDGSVESESMSVAHEFEPCGPRIHTRRNRTISTRAPPPQEQIHEEHRQQLVDRMPRDNSERPFRSGNFQGGLGNLEMRFKRPLHSNTDASWFTGNASPDVVYHPWYYNLFIEGVEIEDKKKYRGTLLFYVHSLCTSFVMRYT